MMCFWGDMLTLVKLKTLEKSLKYEQYIMTWKSCWRFVCTKNKSHLETFGRKILHQKGFCTRTQCLLDEELHDCFKGIVLQSFYWKFLSKHLREGSTDSLGEREKESNFRRVDPVTRSSFQNSSRELFELWRQCKVAGCRTFPRVLGARGA